MPQFVSGQEDFGDWAWFDADDTQPADADDNELIRAYARCFKGVDGDLILKHLRQTILDRRLGPNASDAELRFLEGQRSVVAHVISMLERSRS